MQGFLVDEETWALRYLIVDTGDWWHGHQVLIAPEWIREVSWADSEVQVNLTRQAIKNSPSYDSAETLDRDVEEELHTHYGRSGYWANDTERNEETLSL